MQLSESLASFNALGIAIAATAYDDPEILREFVRAQDIDFTLLSDQGGEFAKALGILNEQYEPGHPVHGIPHPGILFVDAEGQVLTKFAVASYRERPPLEQVLAEIESLR